MRNAIFVLAYSPVWILGFVMLPLAAMTWLAFRDRASLSVLIAIDQLGNTLAMGDPDETISSRAGKCARKGGNRPCYWLCRMLHLLDKGHCERSIEADEGASV